MKDIREAIAKSRTYKIQLDAIRRKIWNVDSITDRELTPQENREYEALEVTERQILRNWRMYRTKNGLSNEAVN